MKIRRIRIDSFGGIKNRDYYISQDIQAFYGPNESGKTSTMEFIRSALVPSKKKKEYPIRNKTDKGTLDVVEDDRAISIKIEGKGSEGNDLRCVDGLDPELYRSIFAMDSHTLDESKIITQGDLKSRFLTIPGGENLPETKAWVDKEEKDTVGIRSNSPSRLKDVNEEIKTLDDAISQKKAYASEFGIKSEELKRLEMERNDFIESSQNDMRIKSIYDNYVNNRGNYESLEKLKKERNGLGQFVPVTSADIDRRNELRDAFNSASGGYTTARDQHARARESLGNVDPRIVSANSQQIDQLPGRLTIYERQKAELLTRPRGRAESSPPTPVKSNKVSPVMIIGLILIATGAITGLLMDIRLLAISAVGIAITAYGLIRGKRDVPTGQTIPKPSDDSKWDSLEKEVRNFESEVKSLADMVGIQSFNISMTVMDLKTLRDNAASISKLQISEMQAKGKLDEARMRLLEFYQTFSGEQNFETFKQMTKRANELDMQISTIRKAIERSGLDPDVPVCPVEWKETGLQESISEIDQRIGSLRRELHDILDMRDLEELLDKRARLSAERDSILKEGAMAVLAGRIIDDACQKAYSTVQPGVVRTADRYLKSMTSWKCSIDLDPETGSITVGSADGPKDENMWSSGLRAQVLLSIKLAIAKEMGDGNIPVILDDVLLPFDSERKMNCIDALVDISKEMQIILFTCDSETRNFCMERDIHVQDMIQET